MAAPLRDLPPGYAEIRRVVLTEDRLLIWLNVLALVPLLAMIVWMALWWGIVGHPSSGGTTVPWWIAIVVIIIVVLPLHELAHGVTIALTGHPVRYGAKLSKGVLYATSDQALFRWREYLAVALAPLVGITLLAMVLVAILPQEFAYYVSMAAVLNAGGAIGDLWAVAVLLRYPPQVLVRDEEDGFRIYAASSSIQNTEPPSGG